MLPMENMVQAFMGHVQSSNDTGFRPCRILPPGLGTLGLGLLNRIPSGYFGLDVG